MDVHSDPLLGPLEKTPEGVRVGDCVIVEKIGQGGMGAVYLGRHTHLHIDVAVKVLPFHAAATDSTAVSRFQKEARSTVRIDHPNIVRVFDVSEEKGVHYLVMEFVDGESAAARMERKGPLPERDALEIAMAAGEALAAAHAKGILHRDVKPANILIRFEDGRVKVADLGLAKALGGEGGQTTGLTATGQMMGTPAYMSPEQATDASRTDERTDIYSLGATLYALLAGRAPFEETQLLNLLLNVTREEPKDLRKLRWDLAPETTEAVKGLMAKKPAERPQTMGEAVELLRRCLDAAPTEDARGLSRPEMAGKKKVRVAIEDATPTPRGRTLDDVTPSQVRREARAPTPSPLAGEGWGEGEPYRPTRLSSLQAGLTHKGVGVQPAPIAVRMSGARKFAVVLGILAALGAAGGSAAYLYSQKRAADARLAGEERRAAKERRREDEARKKGEAERAAAEAKKREEEARRAEEERKREETQAKAAWLAAKADAEAKTVGGDYQAALDAIYRFLSSAKTDKFRPAAAALRQDIETRKAAEEARRRSEEEARLQGLEAEDKSSWLSAEADAQSKAASGDYRAALDAVDGFLRSARTKRYKIAATRLRQELERKRAEEARVTAADAMNIRLEAKRLRAGAEKYREVHVCVDLLAGADRSFRDAERAFGERRYGVAVRGYGEASTTYRGVVQVGPKCATCAEARLRAREARKKIRPLAEQTEQDNRLAEMVWKDANEACRAGRFAEAKKLYEQATAAFEVIDSSWICEDCKGSGKCPFFLCKGRGRLEHIRCPHCNANIKPYPGVTSGKCINCGEYLTINKDSFNCYLCGGSGKCKKCSGVGRRLPTKRRTEGRD